MAAGRWEPPTLPLALKLGAAYNKVSIAGYFVDAHTWIQDVVPIGTTSFARDQPGAEATLPLRGLSVAVDYRQLLVV